MIIRSLDQLNLLSKKIADRLKKNDYIFLIGEIGAGKTTFTRYLINYLQKKEGKKITEVLSPTYTILYEYDFKNFKIMHYDLYRIKKEKELNHLGIFSDNKTSIRIIEWPDLIKKKLSNKLEIYLDYTKNLTERKVRFIGSGKWKNFK